MLKIVTPLTMKPAPNAKNNGLLFKAGHFFDKSGKNDKVNIDY